MEALAPIGGRRWAFQIALYRLKMQWSKLKRNVESFFADSVKGRIGLHSTRYRTMHDHDGRAWITLDGKEVINMVHIWKWLYELDKKAAALAGVNNLRERKKYEAFKKDAEKALEQDSFFMQSHLGGAMHDYQSMSIDNILSSENHIIRALGMLDRRFGKRRLKEFDVAFEHYLVKTTYFFRAQAEGILKE